MLFILCNYEMLHSPPSFKGVVRWGGGGHCSQLCFFVFLNVCKVCLLSLLPPSIHLLPLSNIPSNFQMICVILAQRSYISSLSFRFAGLRKHNIWQIDRWTVSYSVMCQPLSIYIIYTYINISIYLSIYILHSYIHISIYLSIYLSVCISIF